MPSIENLLQESWELFKNSILLYSKFIGVSFLLLFLSFMILLMLMLPLGIYFVTNLLGWFLTMGGFFLLILPSLLIGFFFIFTNFEIVLEKQKGNAALRTSYVLVKSHFWQILEGYLLVGVAVILLISLVNKLNNHSLLFSLLLLVMSFACSWFVQVYMYLVYKQVKRMSTKVDASGSMRWIWIISLFGWGFVIVSLFVFWSGLMHLLHIPSQIYQNIPQMV